MLMTAMTMLMTLCLATVAETAATAAAMATAGVTTAKRRGYIRLQIQGAGPKAPPSLSFGSG